MSDKERDTLNEEGLPTEEQTGVNEGQEDPAKTEKKTPAPATPAGSNAAVPPTPAPASGNKLWMGIALVLAVVLVVVLIKPPFAKGGSNEAVATVNGEKVTKDKLYDALVKDGGMQTLDGIITETLVDQEVAKKGIKITESDIDKEMDSIKKHYSSDEEFKTALAQNGMTEQVLKEQMHMQVKLRKLLEPDVKVSDEDIKKFFDENKASFDTPEEVKASHILVATKEEADDILKQLKNGADFATLAKEKSKDPGSQPKGGDLGYFPRGKMYKEFEDAAFKLKDNELSDVVKTDAGYHIIKKTGYKEAHTATFDEKKAEIKDQLIYQAIMQKAPTWLADVKAKSKITNSLEDAEKKKEADASKTDSKK
ncbi:peptidylprolyl isomerase [Paenibacillus sp.]|jgi:foldase protein PrsA|uniref:foldase protein PrsA n=1 Tax=Paenibacillus sp. TaxID=58172 RepID=UPI0028240A04|nr:peptidylprolyl isomerase [Paenibacillus sp.]MDR0268438.1 peptidylprolyl isomerase [Paenibacillus sp.]